jgi:hypothetical protein
MRFSTASLALCATAALAAPSRPANHAVSPAHACLAKFITPNPDFTGDDPFEDPDQTIFDDFETNLIAAVPLLRANPPPAGAGPKPSALMSAAGSGDLSSLISALSGSMPANSQALDGLLGSTLAKLGGKKPPASGKPATAAAPNPWLTSSLPPARPQDLTWLNSITGKLGKNEATTLLGGILTCYGSGRATAIADMARGLLTLKPAPPPMKADEDSDDMPEADVEWLMKALTMLIKDYGLGDAIATGWLSVAGSFLGKAGRGGR